MTTISCLSGLGRQVLCPFQQLALVHVCTPDTQVFTRLSTTAIPLILFPRILLFVSESGSAERRTTLTPLESFLALHLGILLAALSLALIFNIPQSSVVPSSEHKAHGHPLLQPLTGACALMGFISYNTHSVGTFSFLMFLGTATISIWGLWVILFEGSSRISRRTGADKHTSRFIFGNQTAASTQKKRWKEQQAKAKAH
ncbi:hypothetical protein AcW1_005682 [Taiwanofungus camphoratus]|nr:hypothetical protein AcW2_004445 [Antrodia cinnamomea]KAI0957220.1 hypothetical protein AcW1_005682 [Antrodia cinnamomea]